MRRIKGERSNYLVKRNYAGRSLFIKNIPVDIIFLAATCTEHPALPVTSLSHLVVSFIIPNV